MLPASFNPLTSEIPDEGMLRNLPIVWALARIEFPPIKSIVRDDYIAGFQEEVRHEYPEYEKRVSIGLNIAPGGPSAHELPPVHGFKNTEGRASISLGEHFLAVSTFAYKNRREFLDNLVSIAGVAEKRLKPSSVSRMGIRFICRLTGDDVANIQSLVRGGFLPPLVHLVKEDTPGSQARTIYKTGENSTLIAQWGFIPPNEEVPELQGAPVPLDDKGNRAHSWIMDADCIVFPQPRAAFTESYITAGASPMVNRVCAFLAGVFSGGDLVV